MWKLIYSFIQLITFCTNFYVSVVMMEHRGYRLLIQLYVVIILLETDHQDIPTVLHISLLYFHQHIKRRKIMNFKIPQDISVFAIVTVKMVNLLFLVLNLIQILLILDLMHSITTRH